MDTTNYQDSDQFFIDDKGYAHYRDSNDSVHIKRAMKKYGLTKEQIKGRDVHHIDGNKLNNAYDNLLLLRHDDHENLEKFEYYLKNIKITYFILAWAVWLIVLGIFANYKTDFRIVLLMIFSSLLIFVEVFPKHKLRKFLFLIGTLKRKK